MTISSLSSVFRSTSGRLPPLSATRRFWIMLESLKRRPTLLTMASSRSSSSIGSYLRKLGSHLRGLSSHLRGLNDIADFPHGLFDVVVDDLVRIAVGRGQLA